MKQVCVKYIPLVINNNVAEHLLTTIFFTDTIDGANDTYTNITSLPELSNYMTTHFVLISGASLAGCVIIISFGI